ncbi:Uncharacterised protein [Mycobacteroides abscessus subsp. abscessus]|nr:Uncharacterised protein [Mycobacteroides abscessus subsp. abscessus]
MPWFGVPMVGAGYSFTAATTASTVVSVGP